jgi:hypothetical protein
MLPISLAKVSLLLGAGEFGRLIPGVGGEKMAKKAAEPFDSTENYPCQLASFGYSAPPTGQPGGSKSVQETGKAR